MGTYARGIITTAGGSIGLFQSVDHSISLEEATASDERGNVVHAEYYNPVNEVSVNCVFDTTATLPNLSNIDGITKKEEIVTLSNCPDSNLNGKYFVTACNLNESNTDFLKYSMTLKKFLANKVPSDL